MERTDFYREIAANKRRSVLLMFIFALVVLTIGLALGYQWGQPYFGLLLAFAVSLAMAWGGYYYSDQIVLSITRARPVDRAEYPHLYNVVEQMAIASGLPLPKCYVIDDPSPNAFATGRDPEHGVVCVTTGLLDMMDRYQLEGVIAHEMSHIQNYDIRFSTLAVVMAGMVVLLSDWLLRSMFWGRRRRSSSSEGNNAVMLVIFVVGLILAILSPIVAQLLRLAVSRKREYLADASAVRLTRYPEGLSSALAKLDSYKGPLRDANRATAHLFIVNPFKGKGLSGLFSTHPPIEERVARLRAMDIGPGPDALQGG